MTPENAPEIEVAILAPAKEAEGMMDETFAASAPKGNFRKVTMNKLVDAYKEIQKLMGFPEGELYGYFEEDVQEWPADFVRGLAMVASAAEDAGQPGLIDLSEIKKDADVARLAAKLLQLAKDESFINFLQSEPTPPEAEVEVEEETPEGMDEMFMARS
jgi:hypothetical protein